MNREQQMMLAQLDTHAARYLALKEELQQLHRALYRLARAEGFLLKDAPHTRILGDVLYEVLATAATRTEVDQRAAAQLEKRIKIAPFFDKRVVYALRPDWERIICLAHPVARVRQRSQALARAIRACLRAAPVKRLTVRPRKKHSAKTNRAVERKAA